MSRLQEKKLKVRPRNVNNTRRARRGDSCFRARHRLEERGAEGCARRWKAKKKEERRKKRKKETRADRIPSRGRTRINQTKIEIGKTKPSHSSVNRIEISDLVGLVAIGLVPDPITATRPPASLPTDYRLQTILYTNGYEYLPTAAPVRRDARGLHLEDGAVDLSPRSLVREHRHFPHSFSTRNYA